MEKNCMNCYHFAVCGRADRVRVARADYLHSRQVPGQTELNRELKLSEADTKAYRAFDFMMAAMYCEYADIRPAFGADNNDGQLVIDISEAENG